MNPNIFRQFSIRGNADRDLPDDIVFRIGQAMGAHFAENTSTPTLVVGRDVRQSSPRISQTLVDGLTATGATVFDVGLVPTPALNFAVDYFQANGGIMVTASHNPPADNGFKLRDESRTLTGDTLQNLYRRAQAGNFPQGDGLAMPRDVLMPYLDALERLVMPGRSLKIVVDGGNGANGAVVSAFLRRLGHTVIELFTELDGTFPNRNPDPTAENALAAAVDAVRQNNADCGFAFDGDGDRLALIDDRGGVHFGDVVLMLLARRLTAQVGAVTVVHDASSTRALADDVTAHGGTAIAAPVGYAFVHEKMKEVGAQLGGESAGHIFIMDDEFRFDDAILAAVHLLNLLAGQSRPLSALIADLPRYHTSPNRRVACPDGEKSAVIAKLKAHFSEYPQDEIDGVKIFFPRGWALVRPSNTQPALSWRVEGETADDLAEITTGVQNALESILR